MNQVGTFIESVLKKQNLEYNLQNLNNDICNQIVDETFECFASDVNVRSYDILVEFISYNINLQTFIYIIEKYNIGIVNDLNHFFYLVCQMEKPNIGKYLLDQGVQINQIQCTNNAMKYCQIELMIFMVKNGLIINIEFLQNYIIRILQKYDIVFNEELLIDLIDVLIDMGFNVEELLDEIVKSDNALTQLKALFLIISKYMDLLTIDCLESLYFRYNQNFNLLVGIMLFEHYKMVPDKNIELQLLGKLLERGMNLNKEFTGRRCTSTIMDELLKRENSIECINCVLENSTNINIEELLENSLKSKKSDISIVERILEFDVIINDKHIELSFACDPTVTKCLQNKGVDLNRIITLFKSYAKKYKNIIYSYLVYFKEQGIDLNDLV